MRPPGSASTTRSRSAAERRRLPSPRSMSGMRRSRSSTSPTSRPSTQTRSACCTSRTLRPSRPAAKRSISTLRYFMPSLRSANTSAAPGMPLHHLLHLAHDAVELGDAEAEGLHHHVAAGADDHLLHPHVDRLVHRVGDAREGVQHLADLVDDEVHVALVPPLVARRDVEEQVAVVQPDRVDAQLVGAGPAHDAAHLRHLLQDLPLDGQVGLRRLLDADRRVLAQGHHRRALVHHRHEGGADPGVEHARQRPARPAAAAPTLSGLTMAQARKGS